MANQAKEYFKIEYSGGETDSKELTVRELAPSLLAFSDFIEHANAAINGDKVRVDLKFRTSREGSVIVELGLNVDLLTQIIDFFSGDAVTALTNLKDVLGIAATGGGIIKILKWLKNRNIHQVKVKEGKRVVLILEDGERLEISENELKVLRSRKARKALEEFSKPVKNRSADKITLYEDEKDNEVAIQNEIDIKNVDYFNEPEMEDELLSERRQDVIITIESLSFKEGNMWRVSDGSNSFYAKISDENFMKSVQGNTESFRRDDILLVDMITQQFKTKSGLKAEHEIVKVKKHIPPSDQIDIDFEQNQ